MSAQDASPKRWQRWQKLQARWWRLLPTDSGALRLTHKRIYILPSPRGWAFLATLVLMLLGALNYALSLGFLFVFMLGGMFHAALLHAYRQLRALSISAGDEPEAFAGEVARFAPLVTNSDPSQPLHCTLSALDATRELVVEPGATGRGELAVSAPIRGRMPLGRITLTSGYPLGLWRAWSYVHFPLSAWVFPQPEANPPPLPLQGFGVGEGHASAAGSEEFSGLRRYVPGDTPRQIAWKALARGAGLFSKEFAGSSRGRCVLDWQALPDGLGTEQKLSRLTAWVLRAEHARVDYALVLPAPAAVALPPGHGPAHRALALRALAAHPRDSA